MKRTPLKRSNRPLRRRRKKVSAAEKQAKRMFVLGVSGPCVVCGADPDDAHHVIPKQKLKALPGLSPDERIRLVWDVRNGVPLCRPCHELVTNRRIRLEPTQLHPEIDSFVAEYRLGSLLDRELDRGAVLGSVGVRRPVDGRDGEGVNRG